MNAEALSNLDQQAFVKAVGWVFESSPWVAERAWAKRPFCDMDTLHLAMAKEVEAASPSEQLALLRAHPDLGSRAQVSDASAAEQEGAGLGELTHEEFQTFTELNGRYKQKFGFPFLLAVKGLTKHDILRSLEQRLSASQEAEFAEAMRQVYRIAAFRLHDVSGEGL